MITIILISSLITIIIHELAHFFVATICGCKIEELSLGFGKTLLKFKYKDILYKINLLLFGGDCQLKGERVYCLDNDAFCNLIYRKKAYIMLAGCAINLLIGFISFKLGMYYSNFSLYIFGWLNIASGIINILPIPCLDGSGLIFIWLQNIYGKESGYNLFIKINKIALKFWIYFNLLSILCVIIYYIAMRTA